MASSKAQKAGEITSAFLADASRYGNRLRLCEFYFRHREIPRVVRRENSPPAASFLARGPQKAFEIRVIGTGKKKRFSAF